MLSDEYIEVILHCKKNHVRIRSGQKKYHRPEMFQRGGAMLLNLMGEAADLMT
jgi:hypothetical protein